MTRPEAAAMLRICAVTIVLAACSLAATAFSPSHQFNPPVQDKPPRLDEHGDPLPDGAIARIGTTRFRHNGMELLGFTPDGKALMYLGSGAIHFMDAATGKEVDVVRYGDGQQRGFRRFDMDSSAVLSGDGKTLAVAIQGDPNGATVLILDAASGKERKRFAPGDLFKNGAQFFPVEIALSNDGKTLLVSADVNGRGQGGQPLLLVDTVSGQRLREVTSEKQCRFGQAQISRDGRQIVVEERDDVNGKSQLRVFPTTPGPETRTIDLPIRNTFLFELLPDGKSLVATHAGAGGPVRLCEFGAGNDLKDIRVFSESDNSPSFVLSPDGKHVFIARGKLISHWDIETGKLIREIEVANGREARGFFRGPERQGIARTLATSLDGKQVAFSGQHSAEVFDIQTGKRKAGGSGGGAVGTIRFTPDGSGLVVSNADQAVQMWDVPAPKLRTLFKSFEKQPRQTPFDYFSAFLGHSEFSHDGQLLAVGMGESGVAVWETAGGKPVKRYGLDPDKEKESGPEKIPLAFAFAPRGNMLATSMPSGAVKLWDVSTGQALRSWSWHNLAAGQPGVPEAAILALAFSPDGKTLAGGGVNEMGQGIPRGTIILWETATGKERLRIGSANIVFGSNNFETELIFMVLDQMALSLAYSPDGKHLMVGTFNAFHLLDAVTGKEVVTYSGRLLLGRTATFSADGKMLFIGRIDGGIRVLDAASGRVIRDVPAHAEPLLALALSPDGKMLASGSNDSTVLLWDVAEISKPAGVGKGPIAAKDLELMWSDLANDDAGKAYQAMNALANAPAEVVPLLKSRLQPVAPVDQKVLENLLDELNSPKFQVREKASTQLEKLGDLAGPILKARLAGTPTLETRQRIERLVAKLNGAVQSPQTLQALRAIEVLERIGTREALDVLTPLAKGANGHRITEDAREAVERLGKLKILP
jgi:WD40 repeat protein